MREQTRPRPEPYLAPTSFLEYHKMLNHQGIWLPAGETHLVEWMTAAGEVVDGKGTYQIKKLRAALEHCVNFRTAVDVGAHVGMWTMQLMKRFHHVHCFEPVAAHRDCFVRNVFEWDEKGRHSELTPSRNGATLHACALGEKEGRVNIRTAPTSSGDSWVNSDGDIPLCTLDSFNIEDVDFIKLDCEGYELFALKGGEQTIRKWLPTIIVEQKPGRGQKFGLEETAAVTWLMRLGYTCEKVISGDYIMVPD